MLLTTVLINIFRATLEYAEIAFNSVAMDLWHFIIHILVGAMICNAVRSKMLVSMLVNVAFVRR